MPTNPLWMEHTERAAWDTVQTLRAEIAAERKRTERFGKLAPVLAKLEALAAERGLSPDDPAVLLDRLLEKPEPADAPEPPAPPPPAPAPREDQRRWSPSVRWFAHLLERRRGDRPARVEPAKKDQLVRALELRIEELSSTPKRELLDACVEIGCLALELARIARRSSSE